MHKQVFSILSFTLFTAASCDACLWDYDTLEMERRQFPSTHELIVGKFVRHSAVYYKWRITDRSAKNPGTQTATDFDDIAVAYDKLGQHDKAIETVTARMKRWPEERQYEAQANLGTFHIHAGRLEEGLTHISKAIELNSHAHFGREVYQKYLVEYLIERKDEHSEDTGNFWDYVLMRRIENQPEGNVDRGDEAAKAVKGVLGMMRFGDFESPILLEALGDLLCSHPSGSNRLAARAYLKAAQTQDTERLRGKAEQALNMQVNVEVDDIESDLKHEVEEAKKYFAQIESDEKQWEFTGKNLDMEFAVRYYETEPQVQLRLFDRVSVWDLNLIGVVCSVIGIVLALVFLALTMKRRLASV